MARKSNLSPVDIKAPPDVSFAESGDEEVRDPLNDEELPDWVRMHAAPDDTVAAPNTDALELGLDWQSP